MSEKERKPGNENPLRKIIDGALIRALSPLYDNLSWLTPDHITAIGLVLTAAGATLENKTQELEKQGNDVTKLRNMAIILSILGPTFDKLDGVWAQIKIKKGYIHDSERGAIVDVLSDRIGELIICVAHLVAANNRNDIAGITSAYVNAITNSVPSLLRAEGEKQGKDVSEVGKNPLQFLGTRAGRAILLNLALFFPEVKFKLDGKEHSIPLQSILSTLTAISNVTTSHARLQIVQLPVDVELEPTEKMSKAERKATWLWPSTIISTIIPSLIALYMYYGAKENKSI